MITKKNFVESLNQVINKNDKVIVIYSGISSFLNKFPYQKNLTSEILTLIEDFITKDRVLILPSFSANNFLKTNKFDIKNSIDILVFCPKKP